MANNNNRSRQRTAPVAADQSSATAAPEEPTNEEGDTVDNQDNTQTGDTTEQLVEGTTEQVSETPAVTTPVAETPSVAAPTPPAAPEVVKDESTQKAIVEPVVPEAVVAPVVTTPVAETPVTESASSVTAQADDDHETVATLKIQLEAFKKAASIHGKNPEDFRQAAKLTSTMTKYVVAHPSTQVLDTLLAFYVENKDGVCAAENFMKGSTTLGKVEEQQVGFLHGIMSDLAHRRSVRVNQSLVINILKRPEIADYWKRKVAGFKAAAAQA